MFEGKMDRPGRDLQGSFRGARDDTKIATGCGHGEPRSRDREKVKTTGCPDGPDFRIAVWRSPIL